MIGPIDGIVRMFSTAAEPRGAVRRAPRAQRAVQAPLREQPQPARATYTPAARRTHRPRAI